MAGRIQGITVEIGGDTTKLQTALKGVNTEIRNTQSQLRDVDKLLKLDPGNTELLAQKHRLLGDAVKETRDKLETLKTAAEQAEEALKEGTITQEQYDGLQREIAETEAKLRSLEEQAKQSDTALQNIAAKGEKLKTMGESVTETGKKFLPVTGAVAGLGAAAVKTAADFDASMSRVAAVSGATGKDFDALRDKAREMGAKTKFSASEAADAMNYMAMAGWKTEDMLEGVEGVMNLAAASGEDLATTSDIVTDALTAFGLEAKDSGHFADVLAAASSNANTNVSMMGETFKYCAPVAGALGFSAEDTAHAIGLMANAGIKGSQAGTALRTIMNNLSGDVEICGESIGKVSIATTNADGSMRDLSDILADCREAFAGLSESEKAAAAESLVGKNAMSGFLALMNAGEKDINKLTGAIEGCDGAAGEMAGIMQDNLAGQMEILKSQLQELAISFGDLLMPSIRMIVGWIQKLVDWLNGMDEGTRKVIITVALIAAAVAPVLIVVGKVMTAVGTIMTMAPKLAAAVNAVRGAFAALNAVLLANPYVLIIAGIVALAAAFIYLWKHSESFREFWIGLWKSVRDAAVAVWQTLTAFFKTAWDAISRTAMAVWNGIKSFFAVLWTGIRAVFTGSVGSIAKALSDAWNAMRTAVTTVWNAVSKFFGTVWSSIKKIFASAWNDIKKTVSAAGTSIRSDMKGLWNAVLAAVKTAMTKIFAAVKSGFGRVKEHITGLASKSYGWGRDLIMGIVRGIRACIGEVGKAVSAVAEKIRSYLHFSVPDEGPLTDYESWMPDFIRGLAKGIENSRGLVSRAMDSLTADMVISPRVMAAEGAYGNGGGAVMGAEIMAGIDSAIKAVSAGGGGNAGDIVIPVYIGGDMIDEVVVTAQQRMDLRSGGR